MTPPMFAIFVPGRAAPQGSKRHVGAGRMIESSKRVTPWRDLIVTMCLAKLHTISGTIDADGAMSYTPPDERRFVGPVDVRLDFYYDRPRHHYRTGANADTLRSAAPAYPRTGGDIDKLCRAVCDALGAKHGAGVIADDADIVRLTATKHYATPVHPQGCYLRVDAATPHGSWTL